MRSFVRYMWIGALTLNLFAASSAFALRIAPPIARPQPVQAALQAEVIVSGKVVSIDKEPVEVTAFAGAPKEQPKVPYKIAKVKISEALLGAKGLTEIKVGFPANANPAGGGFDQPVPLPGRPAIRPLPAPVGGSIALTEGQEGVFPLTRHHDGEFYILAGGFQGGVLEKKAPNYEKDLAQIQKMIEIVKDPLKMLQSKNKEDRFQAVHVLAQKYRNWNKPTPFVEEDVAAEENKLILKTLSEMPWSQPASPDPNNPTRQNLFFLLLGNETSRLGFKFPAFKPGTTPEEFNKAQDEATAKFLADNMDKIKIKKMVDKK